MTDLSITRTAIDALQAKVSAVSSNAAAGYRPVVHVQQGLDDEYIDLIRRIGNNVSSSSNNNIKRRQTPLVHAGYLLRIQAILSTVCNFVNIVGSSDKKKKNDVTIILLGSGMDVTGIWAAHKFPQIIGHVIEIDLPTVCASKREILQQQGLISFSSVKTTTTTAASDTSHVTRQVSIHHGTFATSQQQHSSSSCSTTQQQKFALVEADLRDKKHAWKSVLEGLWNPQAQTPTLVISEVVLAYIGGKEEEDAVNNVLSGWATALQHNPHSCLVLLEPIGPLLLLSEEDAVNVDADTDTTATSITTTAKNGVLHSYQMAYTRMFQSKLERGVSKNNKNKTDDDDTNDINPHALFAPIGSSPINVARRLRNTGWGSAIAVSLAKAIAASSSTSSLQTANEPFDEHAALLLYAQSYVVACAFPACCSTSSAALFRRVMAPWQSSVVPPYQPIENLWIATIDRTQEAIVKSMFVEGYADLCKTNKSVRKLVKGACKKDFILTKVDATNDGIDYTSDFAKYYQNRGGCFLVAIDAATRQIAGFVALCKQGSPPPTAAASPTLRNANPSILHSKYRNNNNTFFEVQRLFVVAEYRSRGVAGHLMDAVQQFGLAQSSSPGTSTIITFMAATLNVLHAANRFYSRRGFILQDKVPLDHQDGDNVTVYNYMLQIQKAGASPG